MLYWLQSQAIMPKSNINVYDNGIPKGGSHCICVSVILSIFVFFIEIKTIIHKCLEKKINKYINDDTEISSDDSEEKIFEKKKIVCCINKAFYFLIFSCLQWWEFYIEG